MCTPTRVAVHADAQPGSTSQLFCEDLTGATESPPHGVGETPHLCPPVAERVEALMAASCTQWPDLKRTGETLMCSKLKTLLPQALKTSSLIAKSGWSLAARKGAKHALTKCVCTDTEEKRRGIHAKTLNVLMEKHTPLGLREVQLVTESAQKFVPWGWDKDVPKNRTFIPTGNSTIERSQARGGNWVRSSHHTDDAKLTVLPCGRTITVFGERRQSLLRPLHESLYSSLSRFGWLKRGDFDASDVSELLKVSQPNERDFISGDYSASTDNIRTEVLKIIVGVMAEKATVLSDEELWVLRRFPLYTIEGRRAERGSPMGSYLSFPVLCIANRMSFDIACSLDSRMTARDRVSKRCKVNGDDIVFRGDRRFAYLWKVAAEMIGFVVNDDKTGISSYVAELNSTAVHMRRGELLRVPRIPVKLVCGDVKSQADYAEVIGSSGVCMTLMVDLIHKNFGLVAASPESSIRKLIGKVPRALVRAIARSQVARSMPTGRNRFAMLEIEEPLTYEDGERERLLADEIERVRCDVKREASSPGGLSMKHHKVGVSSQEKAAGPLQSLSNRELKAMKPPTTRDRKATMEFAFLVRLVRNRDRKQALADECPSLKGERCLFGSFRSEIDRICEFIKWKKYISPPRHPVHPWSDDDPHLVLYE